MPPNHDSRSAPNIQRNKVQQHRNSEINSANTNFVANQNSYVNEPRLFEITLAIVRHVIYSIFGRKIEQTPSKEAKRVRELTGDILEKHDVYNSLCVNLDFTPENLQDNFHGVAENIFEDGFVNWGRIIAFLGFTVKVVEYFRYKFGDYDQVIIEMATHFIVNKTGPWIQSRGGWGNVVTHFKSSKNDAYSTNNITWFKGVLVTATATIGLGAFLAVTACK